MIFVILLFSIVIVRVNSLENGLARTPPMGWLAWERFRCNTDCDSDPENCISEKLFLTMADMLVVGGWKNAGYEYLMIDDCWSSPNRSETGQLEADKDRFPHGIKYLADYCHKLGLKFGIYADIGTKTCAGYPGTQDFMESDAQTFADWKVDYVKMDGCHADRKTMDISFPKFGRALSKTGHPMVYQCEWPLYQGNHGIRPNYTAIKENCNLWRNYVDVQDNWDSIQGIIDFYADDKDGFSKIGGPGGWNDPDMLVIGNFGLSYEQSKAQMTLWTIFSAPLILSNDLRDIRPEFVNMLQHSEVLKIARDPLGEPGKLVTRRQNVDFFVRRVHPTLSSQFSYVVAVLNREKNAGTPVRVEMTGSFLGLNAGQYMVTDVWSGLPLGYYDQERTLILNVPPMGVRFLRYNIVKKKEKNNSRNTYCKVVKPGISGVLYGKNILR